MSNRCRTRREVEHRRVAVLNIDFLTSFRRNGNNDAMFKDVPYFCYSHLLALITVSPTVTGPAPAFDELLLPPSPLYLEKILTPADIAQAHRQIALVSGC